MSFEATNHVWSRRHPYSGYKVVLLCIADMLPSRDGPRGTWAVDFLTLSVRTDLSSRVVKELVKQLERDGEIEVTRAKVRGKPNTYRYLYRDVVGQGARHALRGQHVRAGKKKVEIQSAGDPGGSLFLVPDGECVVDSTVSSVVGSTQPEVSTELSLVRGKRRPAQYGFALVNVEEGGAALIPVSVAERVRRLMVLCVSDELIIQCCADPDVPQIIERLRASGAAGGGR